MESHAPFPPAATDLDTFAEEPTAANSVPAPRDDAAYHRARHNARAGLRTELLELADQRLQLEGPAALSMRRLANAAGCSTMVLYSTFGDKGGLLRALAEREAERWIDAVTMFADPDPLAWFELAATALWLAASERPHHRTLLFASEHGVEAVALLRGALLEAIERSTPGALEDGVAEAVWSAWSGGLMLAEGARFEAVQRGLTRLWRAYVATLAGRG
jgi:AcrR family transcriptional regulator